MCKVLRYSDLAQDTEVTLSGLVSYQVSQVFEVLVLCYVFTIQLMELSQIFANGYHVDDHFTEADIFEHNFCNWPVYNELDNVATLYRAIG